MCIRDSCGSSTGSTAPDVVDDLTADIEVVDTEAAEVEAVEATATEAGNTTEESDASIIDPAFGTPVDLGLFTDGAIVSDVVTEDCTLSSDTETQCYTFTVAGFPITYDTGPFCPATIDATADEVGIWVDGENLYSLDGEFIVNLADIYDDDFWMMQNEDGTVNITETAEEFELAAVPEVDESLLNHCVEGRVEWLENGEPITSEITIPATPIFADSPSTGGDWGVTLDGVTIADSAPVDAILGNYTIAAFDPCGGHYNPVDGYHVHAATGCSETSEVVDGETAMFAIAMDGFPIHSPVGDDFTGELDECNGHETEELGYHYHANPAQDNGVLTCFSGETAASADAGGPPAGGGGGERPAGPPPGE